MQDEDVTLKCPKGRIKYIFEDKIKYRLIENHMFETPTKQLVIPKALREKVMELAHDSKLSGHQGTLREICGTY